MPPMKPLSKDFIPKALIKAKHYRLLNEPWQAESICRDVLNVDPDNQLAILYLILAISDRFHIKGTNLRSEALELCQKLDGKYEQKYYSGIVEERCGRAALDRKTPRAGYIAYQYYNRAMQLFDEAESIQPENNEDAILRWNACARKIKENDLKPAPEENRILY